MPFFKNISNIDRRPSQECGPVKAGATVEIKGRCAAFADYSPYFERAEAPPKPKASKKTTTKKKPARKSLSDLL